MPKYQIELSDGRKFIVEADSQPSEQDVLGALGTAPAAPRSTGTPVPANEPDTYFGGAVKGFMEGAANSLPVRAAKGLVNTAVAHPAETGAMIGGMAAVPLTGGASLIPAMAAAGLGGAGGAGLGMLAGAAGGSPNIPSTAGGVLRTMGTQGAIQAGAEGGGRLLSGALKAGAKRVYQGVLKPTLAARAETPNLIETALENAVPVSASGAEKAGQLVGASRDAADALVQEAASRPGAAMIDPRQAVSGITKAVSEVRDLPVARPQMKAIGDYGRQYLAEHPGPMTLPAAQNAVRATDRFFDSAYRATMDRGNPITSGTTAAATGINNETRNLLRQAVPGLQGQNAITRSLAGVRDAVERQVGQLANRSPVGMQHFMNLGVAGLATMGGGPKVGGGTLLATEALTNPAVASRLAIAAYKAGNIPLANAIRVAMLGMMGGSNTGTVDTPR